MKHWAKKRKASFWVHVAFVSVPFTVSTASALVFWSGLFGTYWLAVPMVAVVEILALAGLVLYIARIPSPFHILRRLLPFISIVPLAYELHGMLQHNGAMVAGIATTVVGAILVAVAHQCFTTIENLFIDPNQAALEEAQEKFQGLDALLTGLARQHELALENTGRYQQTLRVVSQPQLQLPPATETRIYSAVASQEGQGGTQAPTPLLRDDAPNIDAQNGAQRASKSAMIREYKARGLKVADIIERHPDWDKNSVAPIWSRA